MALRVLIVDDSPVMRAFIKRVLNLSGLPVGECLQAGDGNEALLWLRKGSVDVVLTDINMPGMNGEELVREMAREGFLPGTLTLVVSTDATEQRMRCMLDLGAHGYLTKPFSPELLRERIEGVVEGRCHVC